MRYSFWAIFGAVLSVFLVLAVSERGVSNTIALTGQETFNWNVLPMLLLIPTFVSWTVGHLIEDGGVPRQMANLLGFVCGLATALGTYLVVRATPPEDPFLQSNLFALYIFCVFGLSAMLGALCKGSSEEYVPETA